MFISIYFFPIEIEDEIMDYSKQKEYPDAEIVYKAYWNAEVDRYLLTLKIDGKRSSIVEYEGELKETPGEIYQDILQCKQMDKTL